MPRSKNPTHLESQINAIVARTAGEIAAAVRQEVADEIQKAMGAQSIAPAPPRAAPAAAKAAPAGPAPRRGRPSKASRQATVDGLLSFIADHPGLRAEEIVKQAGGGRERVRAALAALFEQGKVKRAGKARGTTYTAVSSGAPASAEPAAAAPKKERRAPTKQPARAKRAAGTVKKAAHAGVRKFVRRSAGDIAKTVAEVLAFIGQNPGLRSEQILKQFGGDPKAVRNALERLRGEKKVTTKGIKRAMSYQAA
jgi:ClpA/ClpB-like protein